MPVQRNRTKGRRSRRYKSPLDWFAEDPWADPDFPAFEDPDLTGFEEVDLSGFEDNEEEDEDESSEDPYDGWGPVRPRRGRPRRAD